MSLEARRLPARKHGAARDDVGDISAWLGARKANTGRPLAEGRPRATPLSTHAAAYKNLAGLRPFSKAPLFSLSLVKS